MHEVVLGSRLSGLPEVRFPGDEDSIRPDEKKAYRVRASLENTGQDLGFLHGVLVETENGNYIVAGESGSGKTTYANELCSSDPHGAIRASDWVGVQQQDGLLYASDLNYQSELRHAGPLPLKGVILLTEHDPHQRDLYVPMATEFTARIEDAFDTCSAEDRVKLSAFWTINRDLLNSVIVMPTRDHSQGYVGETIRRYVSADGSTANTTAAAVIGLGKLGSELAYQLGQMPQIDTVYVYGRDLEKAADLVADFNQSVTDRSGNDIFTLSHDPHELFRKAGHVFMAFRDSEANVDTTSTEPYERWARLYPHMNITRDYVSIASEADFNGNIYMMSNPVDFLAYGAYALSQQMGHPLRTHQVYSVGLALDALRILRKAQEYGMPTVASERLHLVGNHADIVKLAGSPYGHRIDKELEDYLQTASVSIRKGGGRTIYGPVSSAKLVLNAVLAGGGVHVGTIQDDAHIGRWTNFSHGLPCAFDEADTASWESIIVLNRQRIEKYANLLGTG